MTDSIQEIMQGAERIRQEKGYCPFQKTTDDGIRYCSFLNQSMGDPHNYCTHLSHEVVSVLEKDNYGTRKHYFQSNFVSKMPNSE